MLSAQPARAGRIGGVWWFTWTDEGGSCQFCGSAGLLTERARGEALPGTASTPGPGATRTRSRGRCSGPPGRMPRRSRRLAGKARPRRIVGPPGGSTSLELRHFETDRGVTRWPFSVPDLPYAKDALEPHIDAQTMEIHHDKHHAAYVTNLNNAVAGTEFENMDIEDLVKK